jgi:hypothetical protein
MPATNPSIQKLIRELKEAGLWAALAQEFYVPATAYTPVITGLTTAGTGGYSVQFGAYTRVGDTVHAHAYLTWGSHTGTGTMALSLPFATGAGTRFAATLWGNGFAFTGAHLQGQIVAAESRVQISALSAAGVATGVPVPAAGTIILSATYYTA